MKAKLRILSALIGGTVMAAALAGGIESFDFKNNTSIIVSAAEKKYDGTAYIKAEKYVTGENGSEVSVPVYMSLDDASASKGVYKLCFKVTYDDTALEFTGAKRGAGLKGGLFGSTGSTLMFMSVKTNMTIVPDKPICTLNFKVNDDAQGIYPIDIVEQTGSSTKPVTIIKKYSKKGGSVYYKPEITGGSVVAGVYEGLGTITDFKADLSGYTSWSPVINAEYYRVTRVVDGKSTVSGKITDTSYTFTSVPEADFSVYVTAYDKDGNTVDSEPVYLYNKKELGKAENISVDSTGHVTWDPAEKAVSYTVTRISGGKSVTTPKIKKTEYQFKLVPNGMYEVYITSYDKKDNFTVSDTYTVKSSKLEKAADLKADEEGNITWKETGTAVSYTVTVISDGESFTSPVINETNYKLETVPEKYYEVYVTSYDSDENSVVSDVLCVGEKEQTSETNEVTGVYADYKGNVTWKAVPGAEAYTVTKTVDGKSVTSKKVYTEKYTFVSVPDTDYEVYVTAYFPDGSSVTSETFTVTSDSEEKRPTDLGEVTGVKVTEDGVVTWDVVDNAVYYTVTRISGGRPVTSNNISTETYKFVSVPDSDYEVYVTAYDPDGRSVKSKTIRVRAGEEQIGEIGEVSVDDSGVITWNSVENAVAYTVTVIWNDEEMTSEKLTENSYTPDPMPDSDYEVIIRAYGAKGNTIESDVIEITIE